MLFRSVEMEQQEKELAEQLIEMRQRYDQLSNINDQTKEQLELLEKENATFNDIQNQQEQRILSLKHDLKKSNDTVYQLQFECEMLREDIEQCETHLDERIRSRFDTAIQERDIFGAENEELYVQLVYMKQKLDAADELSMKLQAEVQT